VAVIGGGPAGLMAAEVLAAKGLGVDLYDAMPSVGRKFLLAGRGGLNLTHSEPLAPFLSRYGQAEPLVARWLAGFDPEALRAWVHGLGIDTFVGTSGRVFPAEMKAAPLLRAWLSRLRARGVQVHTRHRWLGWTPDGALRLQHPQGETVLQPAATVLALGGASWPRLGSDGSWAPWLLERGVALAPLQPANCGFDVGLPSPEGNGDAKHAGATQGWSTYLRKRYAGQPLKPVAAWVDDAKGRTAPRRGEFVLTDTGVEGSLVYALSARLRDALLQTGQATLWLDLLPDHTPEQVLTEVKRPRGPRSLATHLKSRLNIAGLKLALLHELLGAEGLDDPARLAAALKALPLPLRAPRPMDEAISTAGGVHLDALTDGLMLRALPGVFCAGEMLDWEAPTGGYLLTACMASGRVAAQGVIDWLAETASGTASAPMPL
jgi:predicted Rossmann fold flavoprotein